MFIDGFWVPCTRNKEDRYEVWRCGAERYALPVKIVTRVHQDPVTGAGVIYVGDAAEARRGLRAHTHVVAVDPGGLDLDEPRWAEDDLVPYSGILRSIQEASERAVGFVGEKSEWRRVKLPALILPVNKGSR